MMSLLLFPIMVFSQPLVIAHRGASGYRPEHTLEAYQLAIDQGADYIEPDLVMTKDGVLVARHENEIARTTNAEKYFADRRKKKKIDDEEFDGIFTEDLTLAELKTLRARQRLKGRSQEFDDQFGIPTFAEVVQLAEKKSKETGRQIGIYPELKHPSYFAEIGLPMEKVFAEDLRKAGLATPSARVFVQAFDMQSLKKLKTLLPNRLIFLIHEVDKVTPTKLKEYRKSVHGIGIWKDLVIPQQKDRSLGKVTAVVRDAKQAGLKVHVYTFRSDPDQLPIDYKGDPTAEYVRFFKLGVDGVFSDFPDHAVKARQEYQHPKKKG